MNLKKKCWLKYSFVAFEINLVVQISHEVFNDFFCVFRDIFTPAFLQCLNSINDCKKKIFLENKHRCLNQISKLTVASLHCFTVLNFAKF